MTRTFTLGHSSRTKQYLYSNIQWTTLSNTCQKQCCWQCLVPWLAPTLGRVWCYFQLPLVSLHGAPISLYGAYTPENSCDQFEHQFMGSLSNLILVLFCPLSTPTSLFRFPPLQIWIHLLATLWGSSFPSLFMQGTLLLLMGVCWLTLGFFLTSIGWPPLLVKK